jgi:hypothetical protein
MTINNSLLSKRFLFNTLLASLLILANTSAMANDDNITKALQTTDLSDEWADAWVEAPPPSPWQLTGFVEAGYGQFLQHNIVDSTASLNEISARVNLDYSHELFEASGKLDSYYDAVLAKKIFHTRELSISASPFSFIDIKVGRQVLTWGTGDYLFLNDLFAKDWQSFFSGRADEYLKAPSNSIRSNWFFNQINFSLVWTPEFTPDNYITGERFSFYSPQAQQIVAPEQGFSVDKTHKAQWSARLKIRINDVEFSLYGYQGFWPTPVGSKILVENLEENTPSSQSHNQNQNQAYFPRLNSWGVSALAPFKAGIVNFEYAAYNSIEDQHGDKGLIANGQHRLLIGYERELARNFTAGLQYYLERTKRYQALVDNSLVPEQLVAENRHLLTLRLSYRAQRQTLLYSLFTFYSPSDKDGYVKPAVNYQYNDQWLLSAGANVFFGRHEYSFFGQHQDNSNAWLRVRYQY